MGVKTKLRPLGPSGTSPSPTIVFHFQSRKGENTPTPTICSNHKRHLHLGDMERIQTKTKPGRTVCARPSPASHRLQKSFTGCVLQEPAPENPRPSRQGSKRDELCQLGPLRSHRPGRGQRLGWGQRCRAQGPGRRLTVATCFTGPWAPCYNQCPATYQALLLEQLRNKLTSPH